jgi:hypothetical protein
MAVHDHGGEWSVALLECATLLATIRWEAPTIERVLTEEMEIATPAS